MRIEPVEIYSDATNAAILRHPGRRFPGVLIQGDTLFGLCSRADAACQQGQRQFDSEAYEELDELRNILQGLLAHYKSVLSDHDIPLPF